MSSNHYQKEDDPQDTPENMLANWNATSNALDGVTVATAEQLNRNYELLDYVEQIVPDSDKPYVQESKAIALKMAERITQYDVARLAANNAVKEFYDRTRRVAGDYEELQNAVAEVDRSNPMVDRLVELVEEEVAEDTYDRMAEYEYQEAFTEAYENVFQEIHDGLCDVTGSRDWRAIFNLGDLLVGNTQPTDRQRELLAALLETCKDSETVDATE